MFLFSLLVILSLLLGCSAPKLEVKLDPKIERTDDNKVKVAFSTNLPDGTEVMIKISGKNGYVAQDKGKIEKGTFTSNLFSDGGKPLKSGDFQYEITTPIVSTQSDSVQKIFGEKGSNLIGTYVKQDSSLGENIVYYSSNFNIVNKVDNEYKEWVKLHDIKIQAQVIFFLNVLLEQNGKIHSSPNMYQTLTLLENLADEALSKATTDEDLIVLDEKYKKSMKEFKEMSDKIMEGTTTSNNELIIEGVKHFDEGNKLLEEAEKLIKELK